MPIRKIVSDIIVQSKQRLNDGVKTLFGTNEDWSIRSDGTDLIIEEEGNQVALRLNAGNKIQDEFESGGAHEMNVGSLSGDLADAQDPTAHATDHEGGGSDEVTIENLPTGSNDTSQFFEPDGSGGVQLGGVSGSVMTNTGQYLASLGG